MKIVGVDFVTTPSKRCPLFVVTGVLQDDLLSLTSIEQFDDDALGRVLQRQGPWVMGLDVPFGLPSEFLEAVDLPRSWEDYSRRISAMDWPQLKSMIDRFRAPRPPGTKEPLRPCDRAAGSLSPLKTANPPLARMFQVAMGTLLDARCDVLPMRMTGDDRVVVEVYPKLIAQRLKPSGRYKSATKGDQHASVRAAMMSRLREGALKQAFGLRVECSADVDKCSIENEPGEAIDSVFAAVSAAWAYRRSDQQWGVSVSGNVDTGWIVDPDLCKDEETPAATPTVQSQVRDLKHILAGKEGEEKKPTLAVAESLSCGNLQALLGSVSGASKFFVGGITAYTRDQKVKLLEVNAEHARAVDCVSERVASEMAVGVAKLMGAPLAVATTGWAEPDAQRTIPHPHAYCAVVANGRVTTILVDGHEMSRTAMQQHVAACALSHLLDRLREKP